MVLLFRTIILPLLYHSRTTLNCYNYYKTFPKFSSLEKMKKNKNGAKTLPREGSSFGGDPPDLIMDGSVPVPVKRLKMPHDTHQQSPSLSSSPEGPKCYLSKVKSIKNQPEKEFSSPAARCNIGSEHTRVNKRRTPTDLGTKEDVLNTDADTSFGFSFDISNSSDLENLPMNVASQREKSFPPTQFGKQSNPAFFKRPKSNISYSNLVASQKLDCSVSLPKFEPFDICLPGDRRPFMEGTHKSILRPGMVLLKYFITHDEQVEIVRTCRKLGLGPGGFYQPRYKDGAKLRLQMMCLGLDWDPQTRKYANKRTIDGSEPPCIPHEFSLLVENAIEEAHSLIKKETVSNAEDILPSMSPDTCIVNFYTTSGRLGLHQDRDESKGSLRKGLPIVSFSVGDAAEFLYGEQRDVEKAEKVVLESGDVLIFGGKSRHIFHGVSSIIPHSAPKALIEDTRLRPGRLNLTFRHY
ncbi:alpha-ketoglutarate-dependent dioxygenase AlkB-like [Quillaja saponaria]|uniref:DNA N(6)-methyladenine demethylase n=2 Tax=Quillaja saponaria TaxID=32244 RepID=A0AAD7PMD9_QUISA|nr:alpha-ketoglutarate-dependent dioxygenase AlkB-like [Quillaja saponaria]